MLPFRRLPVRSFEVGCEAVLDLGSMSSPIGGGNPHLVNREPEMFRRRSQTIFRRAVLWDHDGGDLPNIGSRGQRGATPGGSASEHDARIDRGFTVTIARDTGASPVTPCDGLWSAQALSPANIK